MYVELAGGKTPEKTAEIHKSPSQGTMQPAVGVSECRLVVLVVARIEGVDSKTEILPSTSSR